MKRSQKTLVWVAVALVAALSLTRLRSTLSGPTVSPEPNRPSESAPSTSSNVASVPESKLPERGVAEFVRRQQEFFSLYRTPITFYGRVVDQHGGPVVDARVVLTANDKVEGRSSEYVRTTDAAGRFSIENIVGLTLLVNVEKEGYKSIPDGKSNFGVSSGFFRYGLSSGSGPHRPDENAPVVFALYKGGALEPLVKIGEKSFGIGRDSVPLTIPLDGYGGHAIVFRCWNRELERPPGQRQYDWRLQVDVPDGGLQPRSEAFVFEAPDAGYRQSDTVDMPASPQSHWHPIVDRSYFVRFNDETFARVNIAMHAGGDHFLVFESYYNPKPGSRNLESAPEK